MRLILSTRDADRLHSLLVSGRPPTVEFVPPRSGVVNVAGERFTGKVRRTPGNPVAATVLLVHQVVLLPSAADTARGRFVDQGLSAACTVCRGCGR